MPSPHSLRLQPLARHLATLGCLLVTLPHMAQADPAVPNAGQLLNQQQRAGSTPLAPATESAPAVDDQRHGDAQTGATAASTLRAMIREVRFVGADHLLPPSELQAVVQPALNREHSHAQLQQLAQQVTERLRQAGWVVARAFLPRQDLSDGVLTIEVLDGRLQSGPERIVLKAETRMDPQRLRAIAEHALPAQQALRQADLERAMLLLNDQPGVRARAVIERGAEPGSSRVAISATQAPVTQVTMGLDNFGGRSTGTERVTGTLRLLDPSGRGDTLTFSTTLSEGAQTLAAAYSLPLTPQGLQAMVSATHLVYEVGGALEPLKLEGSATTAAVGLSYPIVRSRERNLYVQGLLEHKQLLDDALGQNIRDRRLYNASVGLSGNLSDDVLGGGVSTGSTALTIGHVNLDGNAANQLGDTNSARTQGSFSKLAVNLNRFQNLGISDDWIAFLGLSGQWSSGNLDSAEKFILGGPNGVRAYPVGEAAGDSGFLATLELRRKLPMPWVDQAQVLLFVDFGHIKLNNEPWLGAVNTATGSNRYSLKGWGVGLNLSKDKWAVQSAVAATLGDNPGRSLDGQNADGRDSDVRAWLQASRVFD